jgi:hypothetical protein
VPVVDHFVSIIDGHGLTQFSLWTCHLGKSGMVVKAIWRRSGFTHRGGPRGHHKGRKRNVQAVLLRTLLQISRILQGSYARFPQFLFDGFESIESFPQFAANERQAILSDHSSMSRIFNSTIWIALSGFGCLGTLLLLSIASLLARRPVSVKRSAALQKRRLGRLAQSRLVPH